MSKVNVPNTGSTTLGETSLEASIRLKDLLPSDAVVRTHLAGPLVIGNTDQPLELDGLANGKITIPPVSAMSVGNAASEVGIGTPNRTADFAFAVINIAIAREGYGSEKLKALGAKVKEQLGDIDLLLDLSGELTALPDKDSHDITEKMKGLIGKLEAHKIQIWKDGNKLTKEKLSELKAQISSQIDKLRTALQTTISTEIQPEANNLQAIMNIVQQIIQSDARLKRKTAEVPK